MTFKKYENISLYGSTNLPSKHLFRQRRGYDALYPSENDPLFPKPINFRNQKQAKYGVISPDKEYLVCDPAYLKQVAGTKEVIYALNFVSDAYSDFLFYMNTKGTLKMMEDGERLKSDMSAKKAWQNPDTTYDQLQNALYESFIEVFLDIKTKQKITNFASFMDVFMNFYLNYMEYDVPVTYTGMLQSSFYNPMFSGLCIEIENSDHDEDYTKFDKYINNKNFKEYATAAAAFGFMLDKHAPWRLVANIKSPKMIKYIDNYLRLYKASREGITEYTTMPYLEDGSTHAHKYYIDEYGNGYTDSHGSPGNILKEHTHQIIDYKLVPSATTKGNSPNIGIEPHTHDMQVFSEAIKRNDFYDSYYFRTQEIDLENLKEMMFGIYKRFVDTFPFATTPLACHLSKNIYDYSPDFNFMFDPLQVKRIYRDEISEEQYNAEYEDLFFYKIYFMIRMRELKVTISTSKMANNLAKIEDLYLNVDKDSALSYIIQYLKQYY